MSRKTLFSAIAATLLATACLPAICGPAQAGSRTVTAMSKTVRAAPPAGVRMAYLVPSPLPPQRPMPFPSPGNPAPPSGPAKPRPQPDWCQPGMTKCPLLPVPYPN